MPTGTINPVIPVPVGQGSRVVLGFNHTTNKVYLII